MKLYTLISLALGVFGGTYAALAALRTHFESLVKETNANADTHLLRIADHYGLQSKTLASAEGRKKWIGRAWNLWLMANTIPAVVFAALVFCVAIWALSHWDLICNQADGQAVDRTKSPWPQFYYGLITLVVIDLSCFITALVAWGICKLVGSVLRQQYEAVLEEEKNKFAPGNVPPQAGLSGRSEDLRPEQSKPA